MCPDQSAGRPGGAKTKAAKAVKKRTRSGRISCLRLLKPAILPPFFLLFFPFFLSSYLPFCCWISMKGKKVVWGRGRAAGMGSVRGFVG